MLPVRFFSAPGGMQIKGTFDTPHCRSKGIYDTLDKLFFQPCVTNIYYGLF